MPRFQPAASGFLLALVISTLPAASAPAQGPASSAAVVEHKVTRGETLWSISQKHRTSVGAIMDYNHLPDHSVREGMILRIPPNVVESVPSHRGPIHTVKRGEDFWDIAEHYHIKPSALAKANPNVNPNRIHADMQLNIPVPEVGEKPARREEPPARPSQPQGSMLQYTVADDDTFYSIGRRYGVSTEAMVAANPTVRPERLRAGMKVWVPSKQRPAPAPPATSASSKTTARGERTHVVQENESIAIIAKKYGVSEDALLRENKLSETDPIYVDDVLRIPGGSAGMTMTAASTPTKPGSTPSRAPSPPPPPPPPKRDLSTPPNTVGSDGTIRSYIVSAGEDEDTICEAFGISKQTLYSYNHLSPNAKLKPGDEIAIPRVARGAKR